jgi:ribosomal peptide maturation radical SAM protein 1
MLQPAGIESGGSANRPLDVLFAVVPFADVATPGMAASLLKAIVNRAGFSSRVRYFNLDFAAAIGVPRYRLVYHELSPRTLCGERLFAEYLFKEQLPQASEYMARLGIESREHRALARDLLSTRTSVGGFVEDCATEILALQPRIVAFTTTYQQTCAALAVAARLKRSSNPPTVVFGGANCEGEMGLQFIRSFPWVDYVCTGEGDIVFPDFLRRLLRENDPRPLPGLLKQGDSAVLSYPPMVREMDELPIPEYSDYFEQLRLRRHSSDMEHVALLMQTSRGCWWGAKQHCTFCGLNDETMGFRSKSPELVLQELGFYEAEYGARKVYTVDNILDLRYIQTLFPKLAAGKSSIRLFYETKANLTFQQLRTMRDGGVKWIQPGIESFSNQVLRLMQKGVTGLKNIQLLRWCRELGIVPLWNILLGFPGESPDEYRRLAKLLPLLTHLEPPQACGTIRIDRFSPHFNQPSAYGLRNLRAHSYYRYVFPLPQEELDRLAYYFECDGPDSLQAERYTRGVRRAFGQWKVLDSLPRRQRPRLYARQTATGVSIVDTRPCAVRRIHRLSQLSSRIYTLCDTARTLPGLMRECEGIGNETQIQEVLGELCRSKLMVVDEGQYLSLAVWRARPSGAPDCNSSDRPGKSSISQSASKGGEKPNEKEGNNRIKIQETAGHCA